MRHLSRLEIKGIEFPDCNVSDFRATEKEVAFSCDGIYLNNEGLIISDVRVTIRGWKHLSITRFNPHNSETIALAPIQSGELREICECSFADDHVVISGFEATSGLWQEYNFTSPEVSVTIQ